MKLLLFTIAPALSFLITATAKIEPVSSPDESISNDPAMAVAICDQTIVLSVTSAGRAIQADGNARIRSSARGRQDFRVEMDALVRARTTFDVLVGGTKVGTIAIRAHRGVLDLTNDNGNTLPAGVDPVCSIKQVDVTDASGTVILTGTF